MKCQSAHVSFPEPDVTSFNSSFVQTTARTQRLHIYDQEWYKKAANPHILEAKPAILFIFLFEKYMKQSIIKTVGD